MKRKIIREGDVVHIYQLSSDKGIIFYELKDFLVFYTVFSYLVRIHHIKVAGLCIMLNHIHIAIAQATNQEISDFMRDLKSIFALAYNRRYSRKGPLWQDDYGSAIKRSSKDIRSFAAYLYNNPVEKHSCTVAEDYRWNFLRYAINSNPFSTKVQLCNARNKYRKAIRLVNYYAAHSIPLTYAVLDRIFGDLSKEETPAFIDYIVSKYMCIDFNVFLSQYDDFTSMIAAFKETAGKEYDINEQKDPYSYQEFKQLYTVCTNMGYTGKGRTYFTMKDEEKAVLFKKLKAITKVSDYNIRHYIHYCIDL